jgi:hypothetical protein
VAIKLCVVPTKVAAPAPATSGPVSRSSTTRMNVAGALAVVQADEIAATAGKTYHLKKLFYDLAGGDLVVSKDELLAGIKVCVCVCLATCASSQFSGPRTLHVISSRWCVLALCTKLCCVGLRVVCTDERSAAKCAAAPG